MYSPEDQAILEAAYQTNPKPDKAERTELLSKVSLGEKELSVGAPHILLTLIEGRLPGTSCTLWPACVKSR